MSFPYPQISEVPYQNPMPVYYPQTYQQARMPGMDYPYNPDLSYPQAAAAPVNWPVYTRQPVQQKEELVSPLSNNSKFQYPAQGPSMQMHSAPGQYSMGPYIVQNGMTTTRSSDAGHRVNANLEHVPPRSGTALMSNLPRATKAALLDSRSSQNVAQSVDQSSPESAVSTSSLNSAKLRKVSKSSASSSPSACENVCDVCGKLFQKPYNLKSHMKTHSTDRPFKCSFCPKTFARSHDRKRHENLHGGQKNFKCEGYLRNGVTKWGCGKKFARSDALSRHFRTETGYLCIKQFMDEEKEREGTEEHRQQLQYPQQPMHPTQAFYQQQFAQQQQQQAAASHAYQNAPGMRGYDQMSYMPPQISLPPLLRH